MPRRRTIVARRRKTFRRSTSRYRVPRSVRSYRGEFVIKKLRYAMNLGLSHPMTATAGAMSTDFIYRANDLYDVYALVGGHQPRGFDQYIAMFRNFAVLGSKIVVDIGYGQGSATSHDMVVAVLLNDTTSAITNVGATRENPRITYKMMTAHTDKATLVRKFSYKLAGVKDVLDEPELWGDNLSSPTRQWAYHVVAYQPEESTETVNITGYLEFTAIFFNAVQPSQS